MMSTTPSTSDVFVAALQAEGVDAVFGNPGTTELPLMEALAQAGTPEFYLGLQEIVCLGMADGYAQATRRPAVANLHASPGLGNAMGNLYNAWRTGTPLIVTAGQQDTRFNLQAPLLHSDMVRQASQYTKWAWELRRPEEIGEVVRRAFKEASTPPTGPVFLSLPMDLMAAPTTARPLAPMRMRGAGAPVAEELDRALTLLAEAERPVMIVGDRVDARGAQMHAVALAEALGAPMWAEPMAQRLACPPDHPLFAGFLPPFGPLVKQCLGDADLALLIGSEAFLLYPPFKQGPLFPDGCLTVHLDDTSTDIGRSHSPDVALMCDLALGVLALRCGMDGVAQERCKQVSAAIAAQRQALAARGATAVLERPTHPAAAATALAEATRGRVVVDEAVSMTGPLQRAWSMAAPAERYGHRAGGLGWGLPAAIGVALAKRPQRTVALLGDGSAMYAIQGLWTAAHHSLPLTVVVLENGGYEIIRAGLRRQDGEAARAGRYLGTDLRDPNIDWESMAAAMGFRYRSVAVAADIPEAARELEREGGPGLLRVTAEAVFTLP